MYYGTGGLHRIATTTYEKVARISNGYGFCPIHVRNINHSKPPMECSLKKGANLHRISDLDKQERLRMGIIRGTRLLLLHF